MKPLGQYLIEDGVIDAEQLDRALARQRELSGRGTAKRIGEVLMDMGLATEDQLQIVLDRQQLERT